MDFPLTYTDIAVFIDAYGFFICLEVIQIMGLLLAIDQVLIKRKINNQWKILVTDEDSIIAFISKKITNLSIALKSHDDALKGHTDRLYQHGNRMGELSKRADALDDYQNLAEEKYGILVRGLEERFKKYATISGFDGLNNMLCAHTRQLLTLEGQLKTVFTNLKQLNSFKSFSPVKKAVSAPVKAKAKANGRGSHASR